MLTLLLGFANLELGNVETVHVVDVRVEPSSELDSFAELLAPERLEPFLSKRQSSVYELDVRSLAESVGNDSFVLLGRDGTGRVDDESSLLGIGRHRVDGTEYELLLEVREEDEITIRLDGPLRQPEIPGQRAQRKRRETDLVDLDTLILTDDTGTRTRSIEQDTIESSHNLGELSSIDVRDNDVPASQTSDVSSETLDTTSRRIVRPDFSSVSHQCRHVSRLSSGCCRHIEAALVRLRIERHDGQEGRSRLKNVVTGEVLGGSTNGYVSASRENLETDFGPSSFERFEVDSSVDEGLREITSASFERVDPEGERTGSVGRGEEFESLRTVSISVWSSLRESAKLTSSTPKSSKSFSARKGV